MKRKERQWRKKRKKKKKRRLSITKMKILYGILAVDKDIGSNLEESQSSLILKMIKEQNLKFTSDP